MRADSCGDARLPRRPRHPPLHHRLMELVPPQGAAGRRAGASVPGVRSSKFGAHGQVDAHVITFEMVSSGAAKLEDAADPVAGLRDGGMSRRHAFSKMVSLAQGVSLKKELGPAWYRASADSMYSVRTIYSERHLN